MEKTTENLEEIEKIIGIKFKDKKYIETALTHSSYANEMGKDIKSNERLEFLGDAVLGLIVSDYIFKHCPNLPEGDLTKIRASVVCEKSLQRFSREMEVGKYLKLSKGERRSKGDQRSSILADAFEAILAAVYLDAGFEEARKFVLRFVEDEIKNPKIKAFRDYKTALQEIAQKSPEEKLRYELVAESGPDHNKSFTVEVLLNSNSIGKGTGKSKKEAEQQAAKQALELMGY